MFDVRLVIIVVCGYSFAHREAEKTRDLLKSVSRLPTIEEEETIKHD